MNQHYTKICNRCGREKQYKVQNYYDTNFIKETECKHCKLIPDNLISIFKETKKYPKKCFKCGRIDLLSHRAPLRENKQCKKCSSAETYIKNQEKLKQYWEPIIGYWNVTYKTFVRIRRHWNSIDDKQKQFILSKTSQQRKYYWEHLRRANKVIGRKKLIKSFEKYKGKNHWIHRPKTWEKIYEAIKWEPVMFCENGKVKKLRNHKIKGVMELFEKHKDIEIDLNKVPVIEYKYNNTVLKYKTGIYIPSENQSVEIKSSTNIYHLWHKYLSRWKSILDNNYKLRLIVYGKSKKIVIDKVFNDRNSLELEEKLLKKLLRESSYIRKYNFS